MDNIAWYCYVIIIITARTIISIISMFTQLQHTAAALPLLFSSAFISFSFFPSSFSLVDSFSSPYHQTSHLSRLSLSFYPSDVPSSELLIKSIF